MPAATTNSIRVAILEALQTARVDAPTPGPLVSVLPYAGQVQPGARVDLEALGNTPCALVGMETERFGVAEGRGGQTLTRPKSFTAGESVWVVLCVVAVVESHVEQAVAQLDACAEAVIGALFGAPVAGLYDGQLALLDSRPLVSEGGVFLHAVRVKATRVISGRPKPVVARTTWRIDAGVNAVGTSDPAPNPITETRTEVEPA